VAVRNFDGVADAVTFLPGALVGTDLGPGTVALLCKRMSDAEYTSLLTMRDGATPTSANFFEDVKIGVTETANLLNVKQPSGLDRNSTLTLAAADGWAIVVFTKPDGMALGTVHRYLFSTATWTSAVLAENSGDAGVLSTTRIAVGKDEFFNFGAMRLAVDARWTAEMSTAQVQELTANLRTSDWQSNSVGSLALLHQWNQGSVSEPVQDLTGGGANQDAIAGTSVVTDDDPPGWTFDGQAMSNTLTPRFDAVPGFGPF
jgi:hypothetical protein